MTVAVKRYTYTALDFWIMDIFGASQAIFYGPVLTTRNITTDDNSEATKDNGSKTSQPI